MVYIVWCRSPWGTDFMSIWDDKRLADLEASSLNKRDFEAHYFVESAVKNTSLN